MAVDKTSEFFSKSEKLLGNIPHINALGVQLIEYTPQTVSLHLPYNEKLIGNPDTGILAGGVISAFLDNTCGYAVAARTKREHSFATLDLRIDYMKPAIPGEDVYSFAECYKLTRRIAFVRGIAYHDDRDNPIANATATFMFTGGASPQSRMPDAESEKI